MNRSQLTIALAVVVGSWYAMMGVHEAGHCLGAMATGGKIERVEMPLVGFSRTDVSGSGCPLAVVWAGPVFGAVGPLVLLALLGFVGRRVKHVVLFFVGFCLLANGAYIGAGAFLRAGDCRDLLRLGSPFWLLVAFGTVSSAAGLFAWHRMGRVQEWFAATEGQDCEQKQTKQTKK